MRRRPFLRHGSRRDLGVTTVEYALGVALVVVASMGAVSNIEDSGADRLEATGDRFELDDHAYYPGAPPTTAAPAGPTTTAVTLAVKPTSVIAAPPSSNSGNKWIANATVIISDSSGNPVSGAIIGGTWTLNPGGSSESATCTTDSSGRCILQRTDISDGKPDAVLTITSITGVGLIWTPLPSDVTSVAVACPGSPSTCD